MEWIELDGDSDSARRATSLVQRCRRHLFFLGMGCGVLDDRRQKPNPHRGVERDEWSVATSPHVGSGPNTLLGVAALSTGYAWAVGEYTDDMGSNQSLIEAYC